MPFRVVAYDPRWVEEFDHERVRLERMLAPWLSGGVHHIGSTSVPGLAAKPILDMIAGVAELAAARPADKRAFVIRVLAAVGITLSPRPDPSSPR